MTLPSPEQFLAEAGFTAQAKSIQAKAAVPAPAKLTGVSNEMRSLLVQYCATYISAVTLEEVSFHGLGKRLGCNPDDLAGIATHLNSGEFADQLWDEVLVTRIRRASAARIFTDSSWERLESLAVNKLIDLAERNMIRDPGELIAVATAARRSQAQPAQPSNPGQTVNINFGEGAMGEPTLPGAGAKMTIDLSPRVATALQQKGVPVSGNQDRVIDGQMLSASELRGMLMNRASASDTATEGDDILEADSNRDGDIT
jgi:hypothetical protein